MKDIHFAAFCHFLADIFPILSHLSLQMQRNDIILPTVVSHLKETTLKVECLVKRPVPDGHLAKFMQKVEGTQTFQGVDLTGSLSSNTNKFSPLSLFALSVTLKNSNFPPMFNKQHHSIPLLFCTGSRDVCMSCFHFTIKHKWSLRMLHTV